MDLRDLDTSVPPTPADPSEAARWDHTRLRRRLLYGVATEDVRRRMQLAFGALRSDVIGEPDLSANPFAATCSAAAALYDREPRISHPSVADEQALRPYVKRAALWPLLQRVQRDTLGMREMLLRVDARSTPTGPEVVYRPVPPDQVVATADAERPDHLAEVRHAQYLPGSDGRYRWVHEVWSLVGEPRHAFETIPGVSEQPVDVSALYGMPDDGERGDGYRWRRLDDTPCLPWVVYHAALTGHLWDPYYGSEIVYGTLDVAVLWSYHSHILRNAAFEVRFTLGATIGGQVTEGTERPRQRVITDPTAVLSLSRDPDFDGQPQFSSIGPSADPLAVAEAIGMRERRLVAYAGLNPADVQRASGDPRSGYSLAITREGQREAQRRYGPIFRPVDEEVLSLTATAIRIYGGPMIAEDGWSVTHQMLPASPEERDAERGDTLELLSARLLSPAEARSRLLGETLAEAEAALRRIASPSADPETPEDAAAEAGDTEAE